MKVRNESLIYSLLSNNLATQNLPELAISSGLSSCFGVQSRDLVSIQVERISPGYGVLGSP